MKKYPKTVTLKGGISVVIRRLTKKDGPALLAFFRALPDSDRLFLKEDVTQKDVIDRWIKELNYNKVLPLVAEKDSRIIGDATLHFNTFGWHRHMAEIRCVIAKEHQKKGLATILMRELLSSATEKGVAMISATTVNTQIYAQKVFERLGFNKEAELKGFVTDIQGKKHNLVVMVNDVSELWKKMEDLLLDYDTRIEE